MTINPIKYPLNIQQNDYLNCDGNYRCGNFSATNKQEPPSIFLGQNGNKTPKNIAFAEYENNISKQNKLVQRHEEAHRIESGPQASGSPVYVTETDKDGRLIIKGGHQGVNVPQPVDKNASLSTINQAIIAAQYAKKGALAPQSFDELSDADKSVAAKSESVLRTAEEAKAQKLSLQARLGINPEQKADPVLIKKAEDNQAKQNTPKIPILGQKVNFFG